MPRCTAKKSNGFNCKNLTTNDLGLCAVHMSKRKKLIEDVEKNNIDDTKEMKDTIHSLINRITILEGEISKLQVHDKTIPKKKRNMTELGLIRKAKFIYYKSLKNDATIINDLRAKLQASGLHTTKKNGEETIPWVMVKECTDSLFDALSDEDKHMWYNKVDTL